MVSRSGENNVESLEMRGSGPGHRKQARLDPDVRAAHNDEAQVTGNMRLVVILNNLPIHDKRFWVNIPSLLTQGREERYVRRIHALHHVILLRPHEFSVNPRLLNRRQQKR